MKQAHRERVLSAAARQWSDGPPPSYRREYPLHQAIHRSRESPFEARPSLLPGTFGVLVSPEPVSPELVLVDPELAECERVRLVEKARLAEYLARSEVRAAAQPAVPVPRDEPRSDFSRRLAHVGRRKLLPAALLCSLLANGFFAADLVTRADKTGGTAALQVAARPTGVSPVTTPSVTSVTRSAVVSGGAFRRHLTNKALVERKLVALILTAPARKLPRTFIDPTTGLVKSNVRVICHRASRRSYGCAVRLPPGSGKGHLAVAYRVAHGKGLFKWYGYRTG
jgi:hypothetical protein